MSASRLHHIIQAIQHYLVQGQPVTPPTFEAGTDWPNLKRYNPLGTYPVETGLMTPQEMEMPADFIAAYRAEWRNRTNSVARQQWPQAKRNVWERVMDALAPDANGDGYQVLEDFSVGYLHSWWFEHTVKTLDEVATQTYKALSAQASMMFVQQLRAHGVNDDDIMTIFGTFVRRSMDAYEVFVREYAKTNPDVMQRITETSVYPMFTFLAMRDVLYDRPRADRETAAALTTSTEHLTAMQRYAYGYPARNIPSGGDLTAVERLREKRSALQKASGPTP